MCQFCFDKHDRIDAGARSRETLSSVMSSRLPVLLSSVALLGIAGTLLAATQDRGDTPSATRAGTRLLRELAQAKGGATITLAPGDYGTVTFPRRTFRPAVQLKAQGARFTGLVLKNVSGVAITGGTVTGPGGRSYGVTITGGNDIALDNMTITGAHRGIVLTKSDGVTISNNVFTGLISDGIDIASARHIVIRGNSCRNFSPVNSVFDEQGKKVREGDHPDCIQAWSRPPSPPTSDVIVENNEIDGAMQGVFFGNHVRNGIDDGGFDRVIIRNNRIRVDHANGIVLGNARNSIVTGNSVSTLPGAVNLRRPGARVRTTIRVDDGSNNQICQNVVPDFPRSPFALPCR